MKLSINFLACIFLIVYFNSNALIPHKGTLANSKFKLSFITNTKLSGTSVKALVDDEELLGWRKISIIFWITRWSLKIYDFIILGDQKGDYRSGFVSILGNPNVGKSTLMNSLLNESLCIVSPKPQTTRHRITGVLSTENYQLIFSDTPGMLEPAYKLQETMAESVSTYIMQ